MPCLHSWPKLKTIQGKPPTALQYGNQLRSSIIPSPGIALNKGGHNYMYCKSRNIRMHFIFVCFVRKGHRTKIKGTVNCVFCITFCIRIVYFHYFVLRYFVRNVPLGFVQNYRAYEMWSDSTVRILSRTNISRFTTSNLSLVLGLSCALSCVQ